MSGKWALRPPPPLLRLLLTLLIQRVLLPLVLAEGSWVVTGRHQQRDTHRYGPCGRDPGDG